MSIAWVLSGGGNHGPLEIGAMQALFAYGIKPDMLIGTSVGAYNAAYIAADPTLDGALRLGDIWMQVRKKDIYPGNWLSEAWRLIRQKDSLIDNINLMEFIAKHSPRNLATFGDVKDVKLYIIAADLQTATLYLWGDDPSALVFDAVLASSAVPGVFPPILYDGHQLVDGAAVDNLGLQVALDKGATDIFALDLTYTGHSASSLHGAIDIALRAISVMGYQQYLSDLYRLEQHPEVKLHYILLDAFRDIAGDDFRHTAEMIAVGRKIAEDYMKNPLPISQARARLGIKAGPPAPAGSTVLSRHRP